MTRTQQRPDAQRGDTWRGDIGGNMPSWDPAVCFPDCGAAWSVSGVSFTKPPLSRKVGLPEGGGCMGAGRGSTPKMAVASSSHVRWCRRGLDGAKASPPLVLRAPPTSSCRRN
eukprot:CAMPEP_0181229890 /NCGR_PEP_ID=MMETSP1096-20121128/34153_1 /TAXON_ID=156174 ORGANISM="Chrysochromulina ericina, Strain CCMP281" /NCGR_SAMPLE_ID=MMETSP1096 /ASSEMBLY_ACC=CAM_ASM_000453 /LENGTH=112 /DNA_ID=CAMNT_0023323573 /DNA_START=278 /DNA_END=614 /DNA_ORIENTATION=-